MPHLIFVRHGRSYHNEGQDDLDLALTPRGREQIHAACLTLKRLTDGKPYKLLTSPYKRCVQSAYIIQRRLLLTLPIICREVREHPLEDADNPDKLYSDVQQFLSNITEDSIVVSHLRTIKVAVNIITGTYPKEMIIANASCNGFLV